MQKEKIEGEKGRNSCRKKERKEERDRRREKKRNEGKERKGKKIKEKNTRKKNQAKQSKILLFKSLQIDSCWGTPSTSSQALYHST